MGLGPDGPVESPINPYLWAAIGALAGWAAGRSGTHVAMLESIVVGIFGAFIGGDFLPSMFGAGLADGAGFSPGSLGLALVGAVVMLMLLRVMRKAVGPMRPSKSRAARR